MNWRALMPGCGLLLSLSGLLAVGETAAQRPPHPSFQTVDEVAGLPRVLLIGDSISMGYTVPTRELLAGVANVVRIPVNGGPTSRGVEVVDRWLGDGKWDVIHFNFGLHDLRQMEDGSRQVPLDQYEANLRTIAEKLVASGATVIWASTTPVPDAPVTPLRLNSDVIAYNEAAARVAGEFELPVNDLYSFALPRLAEIQTPANVHFTADGYRALAEVVAEAIRARLKAAE